MDATRTALAVNGGTSASTSLPTADAAYPVFPNGEYISRFYTVSSDKSGLTKLDRDLRNLCYLPWAFTHGGNTTAVEATTAAAAGLQDPPQRRDSEDQSARPDYLADEPPCQRAAAINANCYFQNTNGSVSGLQPYMYDFETQQRCYCEKYPYFEAVRGCMKCFEMHGGISGYHWFPDSYVDAAAAAYCAAKPLTVQFYDFVQQWSKTDQAAVVPRSTAPNVLGTQTAASLYYTTAAASNKSRSGASAVGGSVGGICLWSLVVLSTGWLALKLQI